MPKNNKTKKNQEKKRKFRINKLINLLKRTDLSTEEVIEELKKVDPKDLSQTSSRRGYGLLHELIEASDFSDITPKKIDPRKFDRLKVAQALIEFNPDILNTKWNGLDLPIEWAVRHGDFPMFKLLLPHYKNRLESLAISDAHIDDIATKPMQIFEYILNQKDSVYREFQSLNEFREYYAKNPQSMRAISPELADVLDKEMSQFLTDLEMGWQGWHNTGLDALSMVHQDKEGNTLLHHAARMGRIDLLDYILKSKEGRSCLFLKNNEGKTALNIALQDGKHDICLTLLSNTRFTKTEMQRALCSMYNADRVAAAVQPFVISAAFASWVAMTNPKDMFKDDDSGIFKDNMISFANNYPIQFNTFLSSICTPYIVGSLWFMKKACGAALDYSRGHPASTTQQLTMADIEPVVISSMMGVLSVVTAQAMMK